MAKSEIINQSSRVDELRKVILTQLKLAEVQQLIYNLPPQPPTKDVTIRVVRDPQTKERVLQIKQDWASITASDQIAWKCPDGRLEIRFSRATSPFLGDMFEVARGGKAYSGTPLKRSTKEQSIKYVILVTTPDGYVLAQTVELKITPSSNTSKSSTTKS